MAASRSAGEGCYSRGDSPETAAPVFEHADEATIGDIDAVIKLGELVMILDLHRQGLSVSAIAEPDPDRSTSHCCLSLPSPSPQAPSRASGFVQGRVSAGGEMTDMPLLHGVLRSFLSVTA
jgi:hypothetical protein